MNKSIMRKIRNLGEDHICTTIEAMKVTLDNYKNKSENDECKLCFVKGCGNCPWKIMLDMDCEEYIQEKHPIIFDRYNWESLRGGASPTWRTLRMQQLKSWIKDWEEVLKGME